MKKRLPLLAVLILLAGGGVFAVRHVFALRAQERPQPFLTLYGNVDIRQVELAFRVPGRLTSVCFDEGDPVNPTDRVATLDGEPYRQELRAAQAERNQAAAALEKLTNGSRPQETAAARARLQEQEASCKLLEAEFHRKETLAASGAISRQEFDDVFSRRDQGLARREALSNELSLTEEGPRKEEIAAARATLAAAEARIAQAEIRLADTFLIAPSRGTVLTRVREPGAIVSEGQAILTLSLAEPVWVRAYVSEPDLGQVRPGALVEILTDSRPDKPYRGQVGFISPEAEFTPKNVATQEIRASLVYRLRVVIPQADEGLRQGMPVTVRIPLPTNEKAPKP